MKIIPKKKSNPNILKGKLYLNYTENYNFTYFFYMEFGLTPQKKIV